MIEFEKANSTNPMNLTAAGLTDVGLKRSNNEDHFLLCPVNESSVKLELPAEAVCSHTGGSDISPALVCAVADGMGGEKAGEVASSVAVSQFARFVSKRLNELSRSDGETLADLQFQLMTEVNDAVFSASEIEDRGGMGTTLTAILVIGTRVLWFQSGDSRLYLLRDGSLEILTPDQSAVGKLFQSGSITEEQARRHPYKNVIDQCLGGNRDDIFEPECGVFELMPGDAFLLCSDGVMDGLWDHEICEHLSALHTGSDSKQVVHDIVHAAKNASGSDNITAIVAHVTPDTTSDAPNGLLDRAKRCIGNVLNQER